MYRVPLSDDNKHMPTYIVKIPSDGTADWFLHATTLAAAWTSYRHRATEFKTKEDVAQALLLVKKFTKPSVFKRGIIMEIPGA